MSLALHLFGAVHVDRRGKVRRELDAFVDRADADALFVELPESLPWRVAVGGLLRSPAAMLGYVVLSLAAAPLYLLSAREYATAEAVAAREVAADRGLPVHPVDRSLFAYGADAGAVGSIANWGLLLVGIAPAPLAAAATVGYALAAVGLVALVGRRSGRLAGVLAALAGVGLVGGLYATALSSWTVLVALLAFVATAYRTLGPRDEHMLERTATLAGRERYERGVLVAGKAHLPGLVVAADRRLELDVERAYHPRWLRAPGRIETDSDLATARSGGRVRRARTHPPDEPPGEVASLGLRARAALADLVVYPVVVLACGLLVGVCGAVLPVVTSEGGVAAGVVGGAVLYFPLLEAGFGQTVGKRLVGIAVSDADGTPPAPWRAVVRNLLRPVDFLVCYLLGAVVATLAGEERRLGDLAAGTVVRRVVERDAGD